MTQPRTPIAAKALPASATTPSYSGPSADHGAAVSDRRHTRRGRAGSLGCRACRTSSGRRSRRGRDRRTPRRALHDAADGAALLLDVLGAALVADERQAQLVRS